MLHAGIVGKHDATARGVAELANDRRMRAANDADDAAFRAAGSGHAAESSNFSDDGVAMHGVFNLIARDEDVAIHVGKGDLRDDEAITVLMVDETAANFVARNGFMLRKFLGSRSGGRRRSVAFFTAQEVAGVRELFNEATFFQAREHLLKDVAFAFFDLEGARDFLDGHGVVSKL